MWTNYPLLIATAFKARMKKYIFIHRLMPTFFVKLWIWSFHIVVLQSNWKKCTNGPLKLTVTWYKIRLAEEQATHWDIQNKESSLTGWSRFVSDVQVRNLLSTRWILYQVNIYLAAKGLFFGRTCRAIVFFTFSLPSPSCFRKVPIISYLTCARGIVVNVYKSL